MSNITKWTHEDCHQSTLHGSHTFADSGTFRKRMERSRARQSQELTSEELDQAQALANIGILNYQRPDEDLIRKMRKKRAALSNQALQHSAPSTLAASSALLSRQIDHSTSNLPIPQLKSSNVCSVISQPSHSAKSLSDHQDWETTAKKDIVKKGLSLDKVWDHKTWKQKASNFQRLKLLKDDGYDITPLLSTKTKKVSADEIITALLAHIEARKVNIANHASSTVAQIALLLPAATSREVSRPAQEDGCDGRATPTTGDRGGMISDEEPGKTVEALLSGVLLQKVPQFERVKMERRLWLTASLAGMKRKHTHDDEYQPDWSELSPQKALHDSYNGAKTNGFSGRPCTCCKYDKIIRMMTREERSEAFKEQAFDMFKRRIGRDIFQYSRGARRVPYSRASTSSGPYVSLPKPSRIIFQPPASPHHLPPGLYACVSANGMNLIMKELRHIAYDCNKGSNMYFKDPEEAEDREDDRLILASETEVEHFQYHIRLYTTPALDMVIEGETTALIGLVKHLYKSELTHCCRWQYDVDQMEVIATDSVPWRLGDATQSALEHLEKLLEAGQALGGIEARLGYLGSPEKVRSG
ncbi:hypothetical protein G6011_04779 [Alternaria panax]|uniref:Uncharacterized protein n=1 Tax=Alternaria panax TaxID=48097 RepID=A0AAD4IHR6_9PLEO|nr:hypothetical protein G6011_04779 [Alternaria panax]